MRLFLSLIRRELASRPRRRFFYWRRCGLIALFLIWMLCNYLVGLLTGAVETGGLVLFSFVAKVTIVAVLLISPFVAGDLIMREKEDRTLALLYLTAITPGQLLAAKLFTALLTSGALALGVLPWFVLSVSMGGIATAQILLASLLLGCTMFGTTGLGLWAATRARNNQSMTSSLIGSALLLYLVLPVTVSFVLDYTTWLSALKCWPRDRWLAVLSPWVAMGQIVEGIDLKGASWACLSSAALGLPFLALAARALSWQLVEEPTPPGEPVLARWRNRQAQGPRGRYPRPTGNPVLWRDYYFRHGGAWRIWGSFLLVAAVVAAAFVLVPLLAERRLPPLRDLASGYFWTMVGVSVVLGSLGFIGSHARCLHPQRPARALDLLLTTDLEPREILRGKQWAIFRAYLPWLLMALTGAGVVICSMLRDTGWRQVDWRVNLYLFAMMCFPLATAFGYGAVGLYFALRLPRFATAATFGALIAGLMLQQLTLILTVTLPMWWSESAFGRSFEATQAVMLLSTAAILLAPPLVLGVVLRRYLYQQLHALVNRTPP